MLVCVCADDRRIDPIRHFVACPICSEKLVSNKLMNGEPLLGFSAVGCKLILSTSTVSKSKNRRQFYMFVWSTCFAALHPVAQFFLSNNKQIAENHKFKLSVVEEWEEKNKYAIQRYVHEKPFFVTKLESMPTRLVPCLVNRAEHVLLAHKDQIDMWTVRLSFRTHE